MRPGFRKADRGSTRDRSSKRMTNNPVARAAWSRGAGPADPVPSAVPPRPCGGAGSGGGRRGTGPVGRWCPSVMRTRTVERTDAETIARALLATRSVHGSRGLGAGPARERAVTRRWCGCGAACAAGGFAATGGVAGGPTVEVSAAAPMTVETVFVTSASTLAGLVGTEEGALALAGDAALEVTATACEASVCASAIVACTNCWASVVPGSERATAGRARAPNAAAAKRTQMRTTACPDADVAMPSAEIGARFVHSRSVFRPRLIPADAAIRRGGASRPDG